MSKIRSSAPPMLAWQYKNLLACLGQITLHASDDSCPCNQVHLGDGGKYNAEYCLGKHLIDFWSLCLETALMDSPNKDILETMATEADGFVEKAKTIYCKGGTWPDLAQWSRDCRKKLEPIFYSCSVKVGMHQEPMVNTCRQETKMGKNTVAEMGKKAKGLAFYVEERGSHHTYSGEALLATTDYPSSSYGLPVVLDPKGKSIGPCDLLDSTYGKVPLGNLSVLYGVGYKPLSEEERISARKSLWNAGYCLAISPLDDLEGCPPQTAERFKHIFGKAKMELCPACLLALASDGKKAHTHIDSSGCFECELGSACKLPGAGEVFDAMLLALKAARIELSDDEDFYKHKETYHAVDKAIKMAEGEGHTRLHSSPKHICTPSQMVKREDCIMDLKATNREKGCKVEGTGSKRCPSVFAVCSSVVNCRPGRASERN